jgi:superfamily II DNA helicase RecQ
MIRRTIEAGLAEQVDPDRNFRPIVRLTNTGIKVMKAEVPPPPMLVDLLPRHRAAEGETPAAPWEKSRRRRGAAGALPSTIALDADADERFQRLRAARTELARERNVPAYVICHDSTLKYIALEAPGTVEELESIKGMGPMKVKLYGERLLQSLQSS